jgi:hypothetical protein
MKTSRRWVQFFVLISVLVLILTSCSNGKGEVAVENGGKVRNQWEYKVIVLQDQVGGAYYNEKANSTTVDNNAWLVEDSINPALQNKINNLGLDGWEMVGFSGGVEDVSTVMIFKRLK